MATTSAAVAAASAHGHYFWGAPDSLIDWCEPNFEHSLYIAEWYNSLSHAPAALYVVFAVCVMAMPRTVKLRSRVATLSALELRHRISLLGLAVICTGSFFFHATLRYWAQLFDEIPMLLLVGCIYFSVKRRHVPPVLLGQRSPSDEGAARYNRRLAIALTVVILMDITMYVWAKAYLLFVASFIWGVLVIVYEVARMAIRGGSEDAPTTTPERKRYLRHLLLKCLVAFALASICWIVERSFCPYDATGAERCIAFFGSVDALPCRLVPYLHAVWHVLSTTGAYGLVLFLALASKPDGDESRDRHDYGAVAVRWGAVVV